MHRRGLELTLVVVALAVSVPGRGGTDTPGAQGGVIEVFVGDTSGRPVAGATVDVYTVRRDRNYSGQTDANGLARIQVAAGQYQVTGARKDGYGCPTTPDEQIVVEDGQTIRTECILRPWRAAGIIRDEAGNPLAGVKVIVLPLGDGAATSDASGRFEITWNLSPLPSDDTIPVLVARDRDRNLARAVDLGEQPRSLSIRLKPGVTLTGTVLDREGRALPGARVRVVLRGPRWLAPLDREETTATGDDGVFEVRTIPADWPYTVTATADGYGRQDVLVDTSDLKSGRYRTGQFRLLSADLSITGIVVDPDDRPMQGVEVRGLGDNQPDTLGARTDEDGRFIVKGVCEGVVQLMAYTATPRRLDGYVRAEGGATDVKIIVAEQPVEMRYVPRKPTPLKGKSLPPLQDLGIGVSADAEGKMLLVCFWDMGQRPSRNCVTQLAARASQLGEKGVAVVVVHAAEAEGDALERWSKENNVPFRTGRIMGDSEKTRFAWGVVSLPHLILTNKEHIVVAEGFGLGDLDKQIEVAAGR